MASEIHDKIEDKLKELPEKERELARRTLELSARTNSKTVADKLYNELNKIRS